MQCLESFQFEVIQFNRKILDHMTTFALPHSLSRSICSAVLIAALVQQVKMLQNYHWKQETSFCQVQNGPPVLDSFHLKEVLTCLTLEWCNIVLNVLTLIISAKYFVHIELNYKKCAQCVYSLNSPNFLCDCSEISYATTLFGFNLILQHGWFIKRYLGMIRI